MELFEASVVTGTTSVFSGLATGASTGLLNHARGLVWRICIRDAPDAVPFTIICRTTSTEKKVIRTVMLSRFVVHISDLDFSSALSRFVLPDVQGPAWHLSMQLPSLPITFGLCSALQSSQSFNRGDVTITERTKGRRWRRGGGA